MHGQCRGLHGLYVFQPGSVHAIGGWCPDSRFDVTDKNCKYRQAANVLAPVDIVWDKLLDDYENVLRGKGKHDHTLFCTCHLRPKVGLLS
jgi:hypothetical protein